MTISSDKSPEQRRERILNGPTENILGRPFAGGTRERRQVDPNEPVPTSVAVQNAQLSLRFGFLTGVASGIGVGAILVAGLHRLTRRR